MKFYFCVLAAFFSILSADAACPEGWIGTDGGDFCYLVSGDPMNWYSAQEVNIFFKILSTQKQPNI